MSLCLAYLASVRMSECSDGWARKFKRQSFEEALQSLGTSWGLTSHENELSEEMLGSEGNHGQTGLFSRYVYIYIYTYYTCYNMNWRRLHNYLEIYDHLSMAQN